MTVDPAKAARPAAIHVYTLSPAGAVTDVAGLTAQLRLPDRDIGPLEIPFRHVAPGHFSAYGYEVPLPGNWELQVVARTSEIDQVKATTRLPIR